MVVLNVSSGVINALLFVLADIMLVELAMSATRYLESLLILRKVKQGGIVKVRELPLPVVGANLLGVSVTSYMLVLIRVAIIVSLFVSTIGVNGQTSPVTITERRDVKVGTGRFNGERVRIGSVWETFIYAQCIQQKGTERIYYRFGADTREDLVQQFPDPEVDATSNLTRSLNLPSLTCLDGVRSVEEEVDARLEVSSEREIKVARKVMYIDKKDLQVTSSTGVTKWEGSVTLGLPRKFLLDYLTFSHPDLTALAGELFCLASRKDRSTIARFESSSVFDPSYRVQCISTLTLRNTVHLMKVKMECGNRMCKINATRDLNALEFERRLDLSIEDVRNTLLSMVRSWEGRITVTPLELYDFWWIHSLNIIGRETDYEVEKEGVTVNQTAVEPYSIIIVSFWSALGLVSIIYRLSKGRVHQLNTVNGLSQMLERETNARETWGVSPRMLG